MKNFLLASLLGIMVALSACTKSTAATTPTPTVQAQATVSGAKPGECQVVTSSVFQPQPNAATYAPISNTDHTLGSDIAVMTIIEFSDFT
jgi:curli biogenesis system outer membrane secretion channel CsgG